MLEIMIPQKLGEVKVSSSNSHTLNKLPSGNLLAATEKQSQLTTNNASSVIMLFPDSIFTWAFPSGKLKWKTVNSLPREAVLLDVLHYFALNNSVCKCASGG